MDRKRRYTKWQVAGIIFLVVLAIVAIFAVTTWVMSYCHNISFVDEIVSWFPKKPDDSVVSVGNFIQHYKHYALCA